MYRDYFKNFDEEVARLILINNRVNVKKKKTCVN